MKSGEVSGGELVCSEVRRVERRAALTERGEQRGGGGGARVRRGVGGRRRQRARHAPARQVPLEHHPLEHRLRTTATGYWRRSRHVTRRIIIFTKLVKSTLPQYYLRQYLKVNIFLTDYFSK